MTERPHSLGLRILLCLAPMLGACSTLITPSAIRASGAPLDLVSQTIKLYDQALLDANRFLASEHNLTLPLARYELAQNGTLVFVTGSERWPIRIRNSIAGELVLAVGFRAQERDDGFVVGSRPPDRYAAIDNSMFRLPDGSFHDADGVADLLLHETAHTFHGKGTVGYWNTLCYYAEVVFTWRTVNHSAEHLPNATSREYAIHRAIIAARAAQNAPRLGWLEKLFEEHAQAMAPADQ
ncbi:MAG: hypothetical protein ACI9HE_003802 [Planctomycetota bacterium]